MSGHRIIQAVRGLNELQYQISQHLAALGVGCGCYPDKVLWNVLIDKAQQYAIHSALEQSL